MHRYFARRPQNVFSELIQFYSAEGDVVLDPFCGGGVTLVEGVALDRKVIACDINPLATFISKTETTRVDYEEYVREISNIRNKVEEKCGHWFFTRDRDTGELLPVRWYEHAYLISCPTCHKDYPLSNSNKNKVDGRDINGWYICPHCKQASQAVDNPSIGSQMINVTYKVSTRKTQRTVQPSAEDINLEASARVQLDQARKENVLKFPDVEIPLRWDRQQEDCLERKGFIKFSDFFSPRNLLAMAYFLHFIKRRKHHVSKDVYDLLLLTFSATLRYTNNMTISTPSWQDGRPVAWAKHAYWLPYQFVEVNPIEYIDKRISAIKSALRYQRKHLPLASPANNYAELTKDNNTFLILTQDSSKLPIPDESVDLVLTDPPYGSNVQYGELSAFWLSWLYEELGITVDDILDLTGEILIHRKKKSEAKSYNYYYEGLSRVFSECYRVLKNDSPMVFTFNSKDSKVWFAVIKAAIDAGFVLNPEGVIYQSPIENYRNTAHSKFAGTVHGDFIYTFVKSKNRITEHQCFSKSPDEIVANITKTIDNSLQDSLERTDMSTSEIYVSVLKKVIPLLASLANSSHTFECIKQILSGKMIDLRLKAKAIFSSEKMVWSMNKEIGND